MIKLSRKLAVLLMAVLCLSFMSFSGLALAVGPGGDYEDAPPAAAAPAASAEKPKSIPDSFNVNKYLTAPGIDQSARNVGKVDSSESGGILKFLLEVIQLFVNIIGSIALVVFIIGALLTVTSSGKEDRLERGKTTMVYAVIGLVVTFLAFIIVALVQSLFF